MNQNRTSIFIFTLITLCGFALTSCGGGSGSSTATRSVPPDPGSAATATVAGVDTNNNGVRDEVEVALSKQITSDADYAKTLAVAKAYQTMLTSPSPTTRVEALKFDSAIICASQNGTGTVYENTADSNYLHNLTINTIARKTKYQAIVDKTSGYFDGAEMSPCQ
jgi:hypothetical protein